MIIKSTQPISFDDWVDFFWNSYGAQQIDLHPGEVFIQLSEAGGKIAEDVRRDRYHQALLSLADCFCATINMYNRMVHDQKYNDYFAHYSGSLNRFVFERFPYHCPHCGGKHCICAIKYADSENRTPYEKQIMREEIEKILDIARESEQCPVNLDDFKNLFKSVYGQGHQYMSIDVICFHLLEEIGEVAEALRKILNNGNPKNAKTLCNMYLNEFADVTSWIFALLRKIEYHINNASKDPKRTLSIPPLSIILSKKYLYHELKMGVTK